MYPTDNLLPWRTVSTDLVGPLQESSRGNTYLAVFQAQFTKWTQRRTIRKPTAIVLTSAPYEEFVTHFGHRDTLITNNGTQYTSSVFRNFLEELSIYHRLTPPYTAQANPVNRTNKTLKTMIAEFREQDQRN